MRVLVTGGAGFIGSHLVDGLLERGHHVVVYDDLDGQVHGVDGRKPAYLSDQATFVRGDVRDYEALRACILDHEVDVVSHQAAVVGVGQSMYQIRRYVEANSLGTANLLDILANTEHGVRKVVVASSMSIYGEGKYLCEADGVVFPKLRPPEQLSRREWEIRCPRCGRDVLPTGTDEDKPLFPTSIYATTKRDQEEMVLEFGEAYGIPSVALRYFNVYGARQAVSNPYTGVAAIFASRLLNDKAPLVFEDGRQSRDFTHVSDIVQANLLVTEGDAGDFDAFNVGTGRSTSVLDVAETLAEKLGRDVPPQLLDKFRSGDIRHCYADISKIRATLGFAPKVGFDEGMEDLAAWLASESAEDRGDFAMQELEARGLTR
ncbi:MAG: SDR family NAD(P)-dependent oxidoreductase [Actinomycetota bacterium]|nr:SDR family NAD(P)-dependent oxidoreductase [Actinomycetota bacterium]